MEDFVVAEILNQQRRYIQNWRSYHEYSSNTLDFSVASYICTTSDINEIITTWG